MTFGFETTIDLLSWLVAVLLSLKVVATIVLLMRNEKSWFLSRWSASLWWATKITPLLAVPCLMAIALQQQNTSDLWVYAALMLFAIVAVPSMIWRRFYR